MFESSFGFLMAGGLVVVALAGAALFAAALFRRVVPANEVHIVQSARSTTSFGKDTKTNSYYQWPSWIPVFGVQRVILPTSVFDLDLAAYEAYDKGRLPFVVDVKAFFRIDDSNMAAQRVASFGELREQLHAIVQGAVRTVLASADIEEIMQGRSQFGVAFTKEVTEQLSNWGVTTVKNIELMDLRDSRDSRVIGNIMEKKKSHIEMESRQEVAKNRKIAQVAEIEANREVELQKQEAAQSVGLRTVEAKRQVGLSEQEATQAITERMKATREKEMAVLQVEKTRTAEIEKQVNLTLAEQKRQTQIIAAEGQRDQTVLTATGDLEATKRRAEGIMAEGQAKADAEKAMQLAPVQAQITLAKEIGANESYQKYLVTIRQVEASQAIGVEQAKALENAEIKVIATAGEGSGIGHGLTTARDLFSANGGTKIGAMLDGLANTDAGGALLKKLGVGETKASKAGA